MHRTLLSSVAALLLLAGAASAQPTHRIEATDAARVKATITYELQAKTLAASKWMLFLAEPPELPSQRDVRVKCEPAGRVVGEKSTLARKVRYVEVNVASPRPGAGLTVRMEVEATLRKRELVELKGGEKPPKVSELTPREKKYYLSPTAHVDHDAKAFREWLAEKKLSRAKGEPPLELAGRVLEVIRADYSYHYDRAEDKRASLACRRDKTDCGGMTYVFVAAMRANGVPARLLVGRLAKPREPGSDRTQLGYDRPHVRAEFYAAGVGWVPVDPAYAQADKRAPVTDFIGHDPGDLLVLHADADLQLPYPDKVREVELLQCGPSVWVQGRGNFDVTPGPSGWELESKPAKGK